MAVTSSLGHLSMILFYIEFLQYFQAWAPLLVLFALQICLVLAP